MVLTPEENGRERKHTTLVSRLRMSKVEFMPAETEIETNPFDTVSLLSKYFDDINTGVSSLKRSEKNASKW